MPRAAAFALVLSLLTPPLAAQTLERARLSAPPARSAARMTWDATAKRVLLFGGSGARGFRDLWAWDGRRWERLATGGPPARDDAVLAHDPVRRRTVLYGGRAPSGPRLDDTWEWDGAAWSRVDVDGPGPRLHAAGAFDVEAGKLRVHGGLGPGDVPLGDTWEYDGVKWRLVSARVAESGWLANRMVHDAERRRTLLHVFDPLSRAPDGTQATALWEWDGRGWRVLDRDGPGISPLQDATAALGSGLVLVDGGALQGRARTWTWRRGAWELAALGGPSARNGHAVACDPGRGVVVLFGGARDGVELADTWEWDGRAWRRVSAPAELDAATRPPARFASAIAFDGARGEFLLHGGEGADGSTSDTWAWDGVRWRRAATAAPSRRFWASMTHDAARRRTVLFGGLGPGGALGDTWEWDGEAWTRVATDGPEPRYAHELAYDSGRGRVVLVGGRDAAGVRGDTWEWDGASWTQVDAVAPPPRFTHGLAFDTARGELVAIAGHGPGGIGGALEPMSDVWLRASTGWRLSTASGPGVMDHVSAAFDVARARTVVLDSGPHTPPGGPRTWEWDGASWTSFDAPIDVVSGHRLAYDSIARRVLLWTGVPDEPARSRLLAWNGESWNQVEP